ncbi:response regulator [Acidicapsa acidisoli]|uniref:response regulator n=1 Tax=Acidicapsa acidisoli TaxID=1615681 RepID=UPI0021E08758|nr:hybrid sensor histidine kinase/response regulator [Acidicapsa acidisoli]
MAHPNASSAFPRILLIDDDVISLEVLSTVLEMKRYPVDCAEDGAKALEFLKTSAVLPEVILMDSQMPGLSGPELVTELRRLSDAQLIAISGSEVSAELRQATDGFLLKPVEVDALIALLEGGSSATAPAGSAAVPEANLVAASDLPSVTAEADLLIDPIVLGKLRAMMSASAVLEIYTAVASDMKTRLVTLAAAIDAGNTTEVSRIAHTIKGGCAMVGFSIATAAAARLENSNRPETWLKELSQLHFALSELQGMLGNGLLE